MTRRYAQDTKVSADASQISTKALLKRAGADHIAVYESSERSAIAFSIEGRFYRITVPVVAGAKDAAQEERRAWRLLLLLIKAKLEAVREGATTIEREFLADTLMRDGSTFYEVAAPQLKLSYESGEMIQLRLEGPKS